MRIVSLLPSLTELVSALGKGNLLVGVSHECDYPPAMDKLPKLTSSRIQTSASSAEIDRMVVEEAGQLYDLDADLLAELRPDLILTQSQCDVCAVNEEKVRDVAERLPGSPPVESVNPTTLAGVFAMFRRIGDLLDAREKAETLVAGSTPWPPKSPSGAPVWRRAESSCSNGSTRLSTRVIGTRI